MCSSAKDSLRHTPTSKCLYFKRKMWNLKRACQTLLVSLQLLLMSRYSWKYCLSIEKMLEFAISGMGTIVAFTTRNIYSYFPLFCDQKECLVVRTPLSLYRKHFATIMVLYNSEFGAWKVSHCLHNKSLNLKVKTELFLCGKFPIPDCSYKQWHKNKQTNRNTIKDFYYKSHEK